MDLRDYWHTIRRRWRTIVSCLLLALATASVVTWQTTPQYSSTAQLFVSTSPSDTTDAYQGGLFASERVTSYADLVESRDLAERVAGLLGEDASPEGLSDQVEAAVVPETVILEITATDADPDVAQEIAQAYAEGLSRLVRRIESSATTPADDSSADDPRSAPIIRASVVDDAQVPESPVSPQPVRNLGLAAALGLLLGLGLAVGRELLDTSVGSAADVAEVTDAPVLGHIHVDTPATHGAPSVVLDDITPWAEAFRVLRTNMQYVQVDSATKAFVVTSSVPTEGKSTIAVNQAVTLALSGQRVALVECDLRRPLVADRLDLDDAVGTTTVLIGKVTVDEALQPYGSTGLQVMTSGPIPPNPSELLQSHAMAELLVDLRNRFDVVILDAPPLLPVTDAALLAAQSDGAVVVVRHGKTSRDQLAHAVARLDAVEAATLGVVINLAPAKRSGRSYGYGYGYGYGFQPEKASKRSRRRARGDDSGRHAEPTVADRTDIPETPPPPPTLPAEDHDLISTGSPSERLAGRRRSARSPRP